MITLYNHTKWFFVILAVVLSPGSLAYGETYLLVVEGINKDVDEIQSRDRSVLLLQKNSTRKLKISPTCLQVLTYKDSLVKSTDRVSDAGTIEKASQTLSEKMRPTDRFILYYIGQANAIKDTLRLNLPGPDITAEQLAGWLKPIKSENVLVILDCPNAGLAVKPLAGPGRIILCSSRHDQPYSPRFSDYFIPAMIAPESDLNHDGKISLLETLQQTAGKIDQFYRDRNQLKTENFLVEDDGDGIPSQQPWRYRENKKDGLNASKYFWKG
jgi:hypothetical protein